MAAPADEADFMELLIASERVEEWLAVIQDCKYLNARLIGVLKEMLEAVSTREAYVEEIREVEYEGGVSITICEGALGDGVGAKLWAAAHILNRHGLVVILVANPGVVADRAVLELGAGCGACGLVAARLGAASVVLTDYLDTVLRCLAASVDLTLGPCSTRAGAAASQPPAWEAGAAAVRFLDWTTTPGAGLPRDPGAAPALDGDTPPFAVLLGTDILYEAWMAASVAGVLERQLAPLGVALICCAVREQAIFSQFEAEVAGRGLRLASHAVEPRREDIGIKGREWEYEGGFKLMVIDREDSPWLGQGELRL